MYNFSRIKSLSELKELCFYIKAINESKQDIKTENGLKSIVSFLKKEYNLEISVSKLYLFVEKIIYVNGEQQFPKGEGEKDLILAYIEYVKDQITQAEVELIKQEFNIKEPKLIVGKNEFKSSFDLNQDITIKKKLKSQKLNSILAWSGVISLFMIAISYCFIGVACPKILEMYIRKEQEIAIVLSALFLVFGIIYFIMYLCNRKTLKKLNLDIKNYYQYQDVIIEDLKNYNQTKQELVALKNRYSINGIELSNEMMFNYLYNSDKLDVKLFANNLQKSQPQSIKKSYTTTMQVVSKYEQNKKWKDSELARHEKEKINQEIIARIDKLALLLKKKDLTDIDLAHAISGLYCTDLSVAERTQKIDGTDSKYELAKNYIDIIDKIQKYESFNIFDGSKNSIAKSKLIITEEERRSFFDSISIVIDRIKKAEALGFLADGRKKAFEILENELQTGVYQGVELKSINYRYDLLKIYTKIYEELVVYDVLN